MKDRQVSQRLHSGLASEPVSLTPPKNSNFRFLAVFMICCAVLTAAFAVSALFIKSGVFDGGFLPLGKENAKEENPLPSVTEGELSQKVPVIPMGAVPIVSKDLSYSELGNGYLLNETPYQPSVSDLLEKDLLPVRGNAPQVLILHTHTSESYTEAGITFFEDAPGDATYSSDATQNVLAVGAVLAEALKEKGITAIHCTVMHDTPSLGGSYARSAETVRQYLEQYPTISYVIDLHRDAVMTSGGEYVKTQASDSAVAQVMAVVGSDCNGTPHALWQENLALALQLRERLNQTLPGLCRPVSLRNASYNQELAPRYLLLEIGSGANTVEEAKNAARLVGEAFAELVYAR